MNIEWTEPALADIENIRDYIKKDSEHYATLFIEKIIAAVESLEACPETRRQLPESDKEHTRALLSPNYRTTYPSDSARILILAIIHSSRDIIRIKPKPWEII